VHNDCQHQRDASARSGGNLIAVDPRFVATDDFHPRSTSRFGAGTLARRRSAG
jgi:hypothetical protein